MSRLTIKHRYTEPPPVIDPPPQTDPELTAIRPFHPLAPQNLNIDWLAATRVPKEHTLAQYCPNLGYVYCAVNPLTDSAAGFYRYRHGQEADWPLWTVTVTIASPRTIQVRMPDYVQNNIQTSQGSDNTLTLWYKNPTTGVDEVWDFYNFPIQSSINYAQRKVTVQAAWKLNGATDTGWSASNTIGSKVGSRAAGCHASFGSLTLWDIQFAQQYGYFPHAMVMAGPSSVWADTPTSPLFPATNVDSHHATSYTGRTPMGRLWGLPPEWPVPSSWSKEGKWMAETWKRKGAYTVDSTQGLTMTANGANQVERVTPAMLGGLLTNRELTTIFTNSVGLRGAKDACIIHHA